MKIKQEVDLVFFLTGLSVVSPVEKNTGTFIFFPRGISGKS